MSARQTLCCMAALVAAVAARSRSQCGEWLGGNGVLGTDSYVHASAQWDPDGDGPKPPALVVGGVFAVAGTARAASIAVWDGTQWLPLGAGLNGEVKAITVFNGDLIAGGNFSTAGGQPAAGIARWDGSAWHPMGAGLLQNGGVEALTVYHGELIAGGGFIYSNSVSLKGVARWDGSSWQPMDQGVSGLLAYNGVLAFATYADELIIGGEFTQAGSVSASYVARWDGTAWKGLHTGISGDFVTALAVYGGSLYAGGRFSTAGGIPAASIARWNGTTWSSVGSGLPVGDSVRDLLAFGGHLVACGNFDQISGKYASLIAEWDGTAWSQMGSGLSGGADIPYARTLCEFHGKLVAGGDFLQSGGRPVKNLAEWDGAAWQPVGEGFDNPVEAIAEFGGNAIVGGSFTHAGKVAAAGLASWDGLAWSPMASPLSEGSVVRALLPFQGHLVVGGWLIIPSDQLIQSVGRWNGISWQHLGADLDGEVKALTEFNGEIVAGGVFTSSGTELVNHIARWNGTSWQPLGQGFNAEVSALAVLNGQLYAGGPFTKSGTTTIKYLARWNGSAWQQVGALDSRVRALLTLQGRLMVAYKAGVAPWNGTAWESGAPISDRGGGDYVGCLADHDGELVFAGRFASAGSVACMNIAVWSGVGSDPCRALGTGIGDALHSSVGALRSFHGEVWSGGTFTTAGDVVASGLARWTDNGIPWLVLDAPAQIQSCQGTASLGVVPTSGYPEATYRWRRDGSELLDEQDHIFGAGTPQLNLSHAGPEDAGVYDCAVSGNCGSEASVGTILTVCPSDFDCSGFVDTDDFDAFVRTFAAGDSSADVDGTGFVDTDDFDVFVRAFEAGC